MLNVGQVKQGGHDVIHVCEACMHPVAGRLWHIGNARNNQRHTNAAFTCKKFVSAQGCCGSACPVGANDAVGALAA